MENEELVQKIVNPKDLRLDEIETVVPSEKIKKVIREVNLTTLNGLLEDDPQESARILAKQYWELG